MGVLYDRLQDPCCICLLHFENMPNKVFDTNSEYIKRTNKFWIETYSENRQLFESFYRFHFTFMYLEKSIFLCESTGSVALTFHHNFCLSKSPYLIAYDPLLAHRIDKRKPFEFARKYRNCLSPKINALVPRN